MKNSCPCFCSGTFTVVSDGYMIVLSETGENLWVLLIKAAWTILRAVFANANAWAFGFCPCWQAFLSETISLAIVKKDDFGESQVQDFKLLPNSLRFVIFTGISLSIKGYLFICSQ